MAAKIPKLTPIPFSPWAEDDRKRKPEERQQDDRKKPDILDDFGKAATIFTVFPDLLG